MTRFFTYDETIREHHMFNPRVYIEDADKRAGVALYLEGLGYDISGAAVGIGEHKKLSWEIIEMNNILSVDKYGIINVGCITDGEGKPGYKEKVLKKLDEHAEKYRYIEIDGEQIDLAPISCGDNLNLFSALALYRDDTDYGKLIFYKDLPEGWHGANRMWVNYQWENFEKDCYVDWVRERCIILNTLEDILKYKEYIPLI